MIQELKSRSFPWHHTRWTWNVLNGKMEKERRVESRIEKSSLLSFCGNEGTNWQKRWVAREKVSVEVQIIIRSVDKITLLKYFKQPIQVMQQQTGVCIRASQTPRLPDEYFLRLPNLLTPRLSLSKSGNLEFSTCQSLMFKIAYEIILIHLKIRKYVSKHENESKRTADYWLMYMRCYSTLGPSDALQWGRKEFLDK